ELAALGGARVGHDLAERLCELVRLLGLGGEVDDDLQAHRLLLSRGCASLPRMTAAYAHGTSDTPLLGATIGELWARIVAEHPGADALVSRHEDVRWTYAELDAEVERCARALVAAGIERGDRVGVWSPNNARWVVLQLATARAGAILVNV